MVLGKCLDQLLFVIQRRMFIFGIFFYIIKIAIYQMNEQFEKNLENLKKRPKRFLVDVQVKKKLYQYQVYENTTLQKIIKRYKDNGFYDENQQIAKVYVNQIEKPKQTKMEDLFKITQGPITIKLISKQEQTKRQKSITQQQKQTNNQIKLEKKKESILEIQSKLNDTSKSEKKLSKKQLQELVDKIEKKSPKQIKQGFQQHYKIIKRFSDSMEDTITQKTKTIEYYKAFIDVISNILKISKEQSKIICILDQKQKQKQKKKKIDFLKNQKNIITEIESLMKSNKANDQLLSCLIQIKQKIKANTQYTLQKLNNIWNQEFKTLNKINKVNKQITQQFCSILELVNQNKRIQYIKSTSLQQQVRKISSQRNNCLQKIKELQMKIQGFKNMKSPASALNLKSSYLNNSTYEKQISCLLQNIQKYENPPIDSFQTVLQFKKCQSINIQILTNLLDQTYFSPYTRILMVIGLQSQNIIIYSTRAISKENNSQPNIKQLLTLKQPPQKICPSGPGFLMLGDRSKIIYAFPHAVNQIIKYNKKILTIGNRFNILYSAKKKIQIQYKLSMQESQLEVSHNNQLENVLKNKKEQVLRVQIYKVNVNLEKQEQNREKSYLMKNLCEKSFGLSTQATQSKYQEKIQESHF